MHVKAVAIIIILIVLAIVFTPKPVLASPDTYYLELKDLLTTEPPEDPWETVKIEREGVYKNFWYSDKMEGGVIKEGEYIFSFWMNTEKEAKVYVFFEFGYYYEGRYYKFTSGEGWVTLSQDTREYQIIGKAGEIKIPDRSQLYLFVEIKNPSLDCIVFFYYSGEKLCTNIKIPPIVVPEFPSGVFFIVPMLLALYFVLRRHLNNPLNFRGLCR